MRMQGNIYATVGCHPTRSNEFEMENQSGKYFALLHDLIVENREKVVAVGECGLDYDRLNFSAKDIQKM
jgi:TatD DNase family protein